MIRQVLGVGRDEISEQTIVDLVEQRREEGQQIEFKSVFPDKGKYLEFARGVAALANADGGVIVYGVAEKAHRADSVNQLTELAENTSRLDKVLSQSIWPRVPTLTWHPIRASDADEGLVVLEVRPSQLRPHAVLEKNGALYYGERTGKDRRQLTEADVARAYRDRERSAERIDESVARMESHAETHSGELGSLSIVVVPMESRRSILSPMASARDALERGIREPKVMSLAHGGVLPRDVRVRPGRLEMSWGWNGDPYGNWALLGEFGEFLSQARADSAKQWNEHPRYRGSHIDRRSVIHDYALLTHAIDSLLAYREVARIFSIAGALLVRARLRGAVGMNYVTRGEFNREEVLTAEEDGFGETQVDADELFDATTLVKTAGTLLDGIVNAFGRDSFPGITPDGALRRMSFAERKSNEGWAEAHGVRVE